MESGFHYSSIAMQMRDSADTFVCIVVSGSFLSLMVVVNLCILFAGLWFMWDIRHRKSE